MVLRSLPLWNTIRTARIACSRLTIQLVTKDSYLQDYCEL